MRAPEDFSRTLETAADAEGIAKLLRSAAAGWSASRPDTERLLCLANRYQDYAAALRETVAPREAEVPEDHPALL